MNGRVTGEGGIHWRRVLLGGAAGAVICLLSGIAVGVMVLEGAVQAPFDTLETGPTGAWVGYAGYAMRAGFGFLVAWLYAAIRPRFGPGPATGLKAGLFVWLATRLYLGFLVYLLGVYSLRTTLVALLWALAEMGVVGLVAGWLYREHPSSALDVEEDS